MSPAVESPTQTPYCRALRPSSARVHETRVVRHGLCAQGHGRTPNVCAPAPMATEPSYSVLQPFPPPSGTACRPFLRMKRPTWKSLDKPKTVAPLHGACQCRPQARRIPSGDTRKMRSISTSGGRLFMVSIEGTPPTLQDTMVAASVYLASLEEHIPDSHQLIACYQAWFEGRGRTAGSSGDDDPALAQKWIDAHDRARARASAWLSDPSNQSFKLHMVHSDAPFGTCSMRESDRRAVEAATAAGRAESHAADAGGAESNPGIPWPE